MTIGGHYWWKVRAADAPEDGVREILCMGVDTTGQPWRVEADMQFGIATSGFLFVDFAAPWLPERPVYRFQKAGDLRAIVMAILKRHLTDADLATACWADAMGSPVGPPAQDRPDNRPEAATTETRPLTDEEIGRLDRAAHPEEERAGVRPLSGAMTTIRDEHGNLTVLVSTMVLVPPRRTFQVVNVGKGR
jgi:hypothetical protein